MNKKIIYKGYELLQLIQEEKIEEGTKFILDKISKEYTFFTEIKTGEGERLKLYRKDGNKIFEVRIIDTEDLLNNNFVLAEDNTEEIEELENWFIDERKECREFDIPAINLCFKKHQEKINELVKAVKQLRKENK